MQMILSHAGVRVQTLKQPDKHGHELAISLPETSFELSRDRAEALVSLLTVALDAPQDQPIPAANSGDLVFLKRQAD